MMDISGSRAIERNFALDQIGNGPGQVLDIGPGPKPKVSMAAIERGFDVVAVDMEPIRQEWVMAYTLKGDRKFEWGFVKNKLPEGQGALLDIGPAPGDPKPSRIAADRGWSVTAVGLEEPFRRLPEQRFTFLQGDFNLVDLAPKSFDWILNISTIEHFGLAGRYGVTEMSEGDDLRGMAKARTLLKPEGRMLLTIPVGQDAVFVPRHRVYGPKRLPLLLAGWQVLTAEYYGKFDGRDEYVLCTRKEAYQIEPHIEPSSFYGLGLFVLAVDG